MSAAPQTPFDARLAQLHLGASEIVSYFDDTTSDLMRAVASIPAYVERSSHFFAVVPTVKHADLDNVECDFGSWLQRGWVSVSPMEQLTHSVISYHTFVARSQCCVEMCALLLSRSKHMPVIVVKGGEATPYMMACQACMSRPPGCGTFTCCARNHRMPNDDGSWRTIPCDKEVLAPVMWKMLSSLTQFYLGADRCPSTAFGAHSCRTSCRACPCRTRRRCTRRRA
jgi:hypothetical protein